MTLTLQTPLYLHLTEWGRERYAAHYIALKQPTPDLYPDDQGRVRLTLLEFAQVFGPQFGQNSAAVIEGPISLV